MIDVGGPRNGRGSPGRHDLIAAPVRPTVLAGEAELGTDDLTLESVVRLLTVVRADLAEELVSDATAEELLDKVVNVASRLVPGTDEAGIALIAEGKVECVATTGEIAPAADDVQQALGVGPSYDVVVEGRTLRVADLLTDHRWPEYAQGLRELGVRAVLSCPLPMTRGRPGVLTLYSRTPGAFDSAAELVVPVFAARAAIAVAYAEKVTNLHRAIESRQLIGQAIGILMERHRLSPKQAFDTMVAVSQESHLKLRELAMRICETGEDPKAAARH